MKVILLSLLCWAGAGGLECQPDYQVFETVPDCLGELRRQADAAKVTNKTHPIAYNGRCLVLNPSVLGKAS